MIKGKDGLSLLGAIGMGMCPVMMVTALTAVGLGIMAPVWMWLTGAFLVGGAVIYALDYRCHRQMWPVTLFVVGSLLLWAGRYSAFGGTGWQGWPFWGAGGLLVLTAFGLNLRARSQICVIKPAKSTQISSS